MKNSPAARLAPTILEAINEIEGGFEQKSGSKKSNKSDREKQVATPQVLDQTIQHFAREARQACQLWTDESKIRPEKDVPPVVEFFLIVIGRLIVQQIIDEAFFQREKAVLDLIDKILACWPDHPDLAFARLRSKYYWAVVYITQREAEVNTIGTFLQEVKRFNSDQPIVRCNQIHFLDSLCTLCIHWMGSRRWEESDQNQISESMSQIAGTMMERYDSIPHSAALPGWDGALWYCNLVAHVVGVVARHFIATYHSPQTESRYRPRIETLLIRLQAFLNSHQQLTLREHECLPVFRVLIDFFTVPDAQDHWLRDPLIHIAKTFAADVVGSQILAYRITLEALQGSAEKKTLPLVEKFKPLKEENSPTLAIPMSATEVHPLKVPSSPELEIKTSHHNLQPDGEEQQPKLPETEPAMRTQPEDFTQKNKQPTPPFQKREEEQAEEDAPQTNPVRKLAPAVLETINQTRDIFEQKVSQKIKKISPSEEDSRPTH